MEEQNARQLNTLVIAGFMAQGTNFSVWCRANGLRPENGRKCLSGTWCGPKALEWKRRIVTAARVAELASFAAESSTVGGC